MFIGLGKKEVIVNHDESSFDEMAGPNQTRRKEGAEDIETAIFQEIWL